MSPHLVTLEQINSMSGPELGVALAGIFERSPWIPERAAASGPFPSSLDLHAAMCRVVHEASVAEQLTLIRAHPELAGRAAIRGELTPASTREQQGAGLDQCSPEEYSRLQSLNTAYREKFGFPFVLAVKGHTRATIIAALEQRVHNTADTEREVALREIGRIAGFRLAEIVEEGLGTRILSMAEHLARFSESDTGLTCSYLTPTHRATAAQIRDWMLAAGLQVTTDGVGNVIGRWNAAGSPIRTLLTGSHYDTVVNAGKYDGRLGILLPIAVVAQLRRQGNRLPYDLTVIAFAEEEGVRFKSTFLGSSAVAGRFDPAVLETMDATGVTLRDAMVSAGLDPNRVGQAAHAPTGLMGFVEVHIEQGPVLLNENQPLGVVTSIAGSTRSLVTVTGLAGHAGTVPMSLRHDAAAAAAELVLAVEKRCSGIPGLVGTVGQLQVPGGAVNVIPGRCELSVDVRADRDDVRDTAYADIVAESGLIAARRQVQIRWHKVLDIACSPCAPELQHRWAASIRAVTGTAAPRFLPSGAGHDTMVMANITPTGMLFVRCGNGGISHHPAETLSASDADLAARTLIHFLLNFTTTSS